MADKLEREIEEIIRNSGGELPPPPRTARRTIRRSNLKPKRWPVGINAGQLMIASVVLLLVGAMLWSVSTGLGGLLMLSAVILFLFFYLLFFGKRATGINGYEKRWRGQPIEDGPSDPLGERFKHWWRRVRHRR